MSKKRKKSKVTIESYGLTDDELDEMNNLAHKQAVEVASSINPNPTELEIDTEIKKSKLSFHDAKEKLKGKI